MPKTYAEALLYAVAVIFGALGLTISVLMIMALHRYVFGGC